MTGAELVDKVKDLKPVSPAALKLVNLLDRPEAGNDDIVQVLKCDSVLTAKLLRACNSPYVGLQEPVASVNQAVLLLGHRQILHLVLTLGMGSTMAVAMNGYGVAANELWRHSLITASTAELIASDDQINVEPSVAFTVGLLHDIGKIVVEQALTPELQAAIRDRISQGNLSRAEAEKEILGTDHCETGACLLERWHLPPELVESVANHHQPVLKPRPQLSALAHVADCIAHLVGSAPGWDAYAVRVSPGVVDAFGITTERIDAMLVSVRDSISRVDQLMKIK
jgi:putative nucleotidyltransferase with HDIG domain